ncbi:odorant receptor 4 isoform X3 [Ooceraea biroi]|uniref:odorant receptor 4 isoform X3 n=1 Tax=Ooceraea biroi TaxID=2015173 RepID=UPI000F07C290|nr:odorant receptor 4 isoform X3 [Ooceraea biroi]
MCAAYLILHVSGQIDILREWVMKIFSKEKGRGASLFMIKKAIRKHQKIITFSEHIEDLYSNIAMALFVSDTLIICCLGFIMVTSIGTSDAARIIIRTVLFYFVINMEAFIFCFAGEYLSAKSQSIGDAAYDTCWYDSYSTANRIIPFLIMRSQNQLTITIGKVTNLSLERFTNIIRVSASYVSVLLAMY